jgi:hypothetical protein
VLVAIFMDDVSESPDDFDTALDANVNAAEQTIRVVAKAVANRFYNELRLSKRERVVAKPRPAPFYAIGVTARTQYR